MTKEVVLTGLRSNSEFHLGNYLGAILPMVELQRKHAGKYQMNMFIPDLHSFTTPIDHGTLYEQSLQNLKVFAAAGLDVDQSDTFIYRQSYIPAHSELTWILDCFAYMGELSRMTQFKDKAQNRDAKEESLTSDVEQQKEEFFKAGYANVGLFNYPVLMAADILLYGAKWVPVGEDQRQHVEFTRDLAMRMNKKFGHIFVLPEEYSKQVEFSDRKYPVRVRSLRNPEKKMSKSLDDPAGTIMLTDSPNDAGEKIMSATTDSTGKISFDWERQPGIANLLQILALLTQTPQEEVNREWEGKESYGELKKAVAALVRSFLADLQDKLGQVDAQKLMQKLVGDEAKMANVANQTLLKVQKAVGLRPKN